MKNSNTTDKAINDFITKGGSVTLCPPGTAIKRKWDSRFKGHGVVPGGRRLYMGW